MELLPLLGSALLLIGLVLYLARPLLLANAASTVAQGSDVRPLYERKEQLLGAIVELELDREIGKIPAEDFQRNFAQLEAEALAVIAELDQLNGAGSDELERRIEAEVAAQRQQGADPPGELAPDRQETDPAAEKALQHNFCANCGAPRRDGDRFCPQCGVALAETG
jgi:hypothetical protein